MPTPGESRPIIVKKKKAAGSEGHHGGAWKVAYADFVTAMMAFFLLMWLLNATSEKQRKGLADYFNPTLPISRTSAGGAGMLEGVTIFAEETAAGSAAEGAPPKPTHQEPGPSLGKDAASPEAQSDQRPAEDTEAATDAPTGDAVDAGAAQAEPEGDTEGDEEAANKIDPEDAAALAAEQAEQARLEEVGRQVAEAMRQAENGALERHFFLRITPEGLVIEIIDADDEPLFASASAKPATILPMLIKVLVPVLETTTNDIAVIGHTDAVPFGGADYSNWELSADRANAARRLLARFGLPETRIARVTDKAAVDPLVPNPNAPQNRRIAITLLRNPPR